MKEIIKKNYVTFYDYYLNQNRIKDVDNQNDCILAAKSIKLYILEFL